MSFDRIRKFVKEYKAFCALIAFIVLAIIVGCVFGEEPEDWSDAQTSSAGVIVRGYSSPGWIANTNSFPVRIKLVWVFEGETTMWVEVFQPKQKWLYTISHLHAFYVYDMKGNVIGHIRPTPNHYGTLISTLLDTFIKEDGGCCGQDAETNRQGSDDGDGGCLDVWAFSETFHEGVVVYGHSSDWWIKNTNDYPVQIKAIVIDRGDKPLWIKVFQPGEYEKHYISGSLKLCVGRTDSIETSCFQARTNHNGENTASPDGGYAGQNSKGKN